MALPIDTISAWNYGHDITEDNKSLNFTDGTSGGSELLAEIEEGSYTLEGFAQAMVTAMNGVSTIQEYSATVDRTTRKITIDAAANFDLLVSSGTQAAISCYNLAGFTGADQTGTNSYEGDSASGFQYSVQFPLLGFVDFIDQVEAAQATINEAAEAGGNLEVISYGEISLMSCNIKYITDHVPQLKIVENVTGVVNARSFLIDATKKRKLEFIPDVKSPGTWTECILEKTPSSRTGTGFLLKELYSQGLIGYFETGVLQFRKI